MTPAAIELAWQLLYIIPCLCVAFGLVYLMVYLRYMGPWYLRVLFFIPVLIINIIGLLVIRRWIGLAFAALRRD